MRPDIATNLSLLQSRIGDDLDSLGPVAGGEFAQPTVRKTMELKQIAGLHTGGSIVLEPGAYQFGTASGATTLAEGTADTPRFGLSLDVSGIVTLNPPPDGILLDAVLTTSPTTVAVGQVISAGTACFELRSATPTLQRRADSTSDSIPAMPPAGKGRAVDQAIIDWAIAARTATAQHRRRGLVGPSEINARAAAGLSSILSGKPSDPGFGLVTVGLADEPSVLPGDRTSLNSATQTQLSALDTLPAVPAEVDLLSRSIAIVGSRRATRPVAAWIALAVALDASPEAIGVTVMARGNRTDWAWVDALPHERVAPQSPLQLVVIDESALPTEVPSNGTIVLIEQGQPIPDGIGTIIEIGDTSASLTDRSDKTTLAITPIGVSPMFALEVSFQMSSHLHGGGARP